MSDRQRRYLERLKAGRRLFIVELDEVDAEELVLGMGLNAENIGAALAEVLQTLLAVTRNAALFEIVLRCLQQERISRG
jgi:hypothetical protein